MGPPSWLSLRPMLALPLMPTMATTATPDTTVDTVDTMVDTTVVDTDTDTADISARGPLMPNPKLMPNPRPMPPPMPGMATTDMATADTTDTVDTPTVMVDTMVDTGVKLVNSTPNHFFHPRP